MVESGDFTAASKRKKSVITALNKIRKKRTVSVQLCTRIAEAFDWAPFIAEITKDPPSNRHSFRLDSYRQRRKSRSNARKRRKSAREEKMLTAIEDIIRDSLKEGDGELSEEAISDIASRLVSAGDGKRQRAEAGEIIASINEECGAQEESDE